jgi:hypothetical protein
VFLEEDTGLFVAIEPGKPCGMAEDVAYDLHRCIVYESGGQKVVSQDET